MSHGPADCELVGNLSGLRPQLVEIDPIDIGRDVRHGASVFDRSVRFGGEALLMRHSSGEENEDHRFGGAFSGFVVLEIRLSGLEA